MAAFFPSLLPQFAPAGEPAFLPLLTLGLLFCTLTFVWLSAYAVVVARAGGFLRRSGVRRALEAVTGPCWSRSGFAWRPSARDSPSGRRATR